MNKRVKFKKIKSFLVPGKNLEPVFKFNTGLFVYQLSDEQRKLLKVDEANPGVIVVVE